MSVEFVFVHIVRNQIPIANIVYFVFNTLKCPPTMNFESMCVSVFYDDELINIHN